MKLYVNDLIPEKIENMKFLFLLESPSFNEIIFHIPLAGRTGKSVTNFFIKESIITSIPHNYPFGCFLKNNDSENCFGIMNCSTKPLDKKVYLDLNYIINDEINALDRIRKNPKTKKSNRDTETDKRIHNYLYQDFERRLFSYYEKNDKFIIVSCGSLAKTFLNESLESNPEFLKKYKETDKIIFVPHPSFNLWKRIKYQKEIQILIQALKNNL